MHHKYFDLTCNMQQQIARKVEIPCESRKTQNVTDFDSTSTDC